ncbi:hypothetical protein V6N12_037293 [Hibiscus sabdariffa]|uniref:START domain-containing protein n=1 Tax=Hibiscus sabdariffa TaxID=183260 RepID=A0ABR2C4Y3_9ROSI
MRCNQARDFGVSACIFDSGDRQRMKNTFVIQDDDLISDANLGGSLNSLMSLEGQDKQSECQAYSQAIGKAELQDLFPWVPVREVNFLRFCKQHVDGVWVVVDANIDTIRETSGAPSYVNCMGLLSFSCLYSLVMFYFDTINLPFSFSCFLADGNVLTMSSNAWHPKCIMLVILLRILRQNSQEVQSLSVVNVQSLSFELPHGSRS